MQPRITVITICVDDLERSLKFYRDGLGLKTQGIIGKQYEHGAAVFFTAVVAISIRRTILFHISAIYRLAPSPVIPRGPLNRAADPTPSVEPGAAGEPAKVITVAEAMSMRRID